MDMQNKADTRKMLSDVIAAGYANGSSMAELAKTHECSEGTIRNILKQQGVAIRKRGRPSKKKESVNGTIQ